VLCVYVKLAFEHVVFEKSLKSEKHVFTLKVNNENKMFAFEKQLGIALNSAEGLRSESWLLRKSKR
jgi:hypothetical protein